MDQDTEHWLDMVLEGCWLMILFLIWEILSVKNSTKSLAVKEEFRTGEESFLFGMLHPFLCCLVFYGHTLSFDSCGTLGMAYI